MTWIDTHRKKKKAPHANCSACPLRNNMIVPSDPINPTADYWIIGESPGSTEVREAHKGNPRSGFTGASGNLLWQVMKQLGVTRDNCNVSNAVLCEPPGEYETKQEVLSAAAACCKPRMEHEIAQSQTGKVLLLGKAAREQFIDAIPGESITTLHGRWVERGGRFYLSTYHPAFIMRSPDDGKTLFDDTTKFVRGMPAFLDKPEYEVVTNERQLIGVLQKCSTAERVAFDLETTNVDWIQDDILLMVLYPSDGDVAYIIPGRHKGAPCELLYSTSGAWYWKAFWSQDCVYTGHNAKFDVRFLRAQLLQDARCTFDTMLAHYLLDERKGTHDLKGLSARELNVPDYETSLKKYLKTKNDNYGKVPWDVLCQYAAWDGLCTLHLSYRFEQELRRRDLLNMPFRDLTMRADAMYTEMELHGFLVDRPYLEKQLEVFKKELKTYEDQLRLLSGGMVQNLRSTKQLAEYFYDFLHLPPPKGRKVKPRSTNKDVLHQLAGKHPAVDIVQSHRKLEKLRSSYVENVLSMIDEGDVVHCDIKQHGPEHGRIAVERPALQTLPRPQQSPHAKVIRDAYIARPGKLLVIVDFSQAELRIAAAESKDPFLLKVYEDDRDLHSEVAAAMYGSNFTKEQRVLCKMFNFSYLYGGNEFSFAMDSGLDIATAKSFVHEYDRVMPSLAAWKRAQVRQMSTKGYVQYRTKQMRRVPFINAVNRDDAEKASYNAPVAGQASHMTTFSAIKVDDWFKAELPDAHLLLLVHDSCVTEVPEQHVRTAAEFIVRTMEETAAGWFPEVRWKAEAEIGYRWGSTVSLDKYLAANQVDVVQSQEH